MLFVNFYSGMLVFSAPGFPEPPSQKTCTSPPAETEAWSNPPFFPPRPKQQVQAPHHFGDDWIPGSNYLSTSRKRLLLRFLRVDPAYFRCSRFHHRFFSTFPVKRVSLSVALWWFSFFFSIGSDFEVPYPQFPVALSGLGVRVLERLALSRAGISALLGRQFGLLWVFGPPR